MKRFILMLIMITLLVTLSSCKKESQTETLAQVTDVAPVTTTQSIPQEYQLKEETYTNKDMVLKYPQIENLGDDALQSKLNAWIKSRALDDSIATLQSLEKDQTYEVDNQYEIKFKGQNVLSIIFSSYNYVSTYAHPYMMFNSININLKTGQELFLSDFVPKIDETFLDLLKHSTYVGELDPEYVPQLREQAFGDLDDAQLIEMLSGNEAYTPVYTYVTKDALGISMSVAHVAGDHVEFEISRKDLASLQPFNWD